MKWPVVRLSRVAEINPRTHGLNDAPADMEVTFVPMSAVSEVTASVATPEIKTLGEVRRGYTPFRDGDVLFAKITPCMENGKVALAYDLQNGVGFGSTEFHVFRAKAGLDPRYLFYFLRQPSFRIAAKQRMRGAVGQQRVPADFFTDIELPLPTLSEQRRIVHLLDEADALRGKRAEADQKAARVLPAIFYQMFGDPSTNSMNWRQAQLGDLVVDTQYGTSARANVNGDGVPVVRMNNIDQAGRIDLHEIKHVVLEAPELARQRLASGDILFNRTNSKELVGKTGLWRNGQIAVAASYLIRVRVDTSRVLPEFLWAYMNTPYLKQILFDTGRRAIGMANINAQELRALPVLVPDLDRQRTFAVRLTAWENVEAAQVAARSKLQKLFDVALHRAFTGQLTAKWREAHSAQLLGEMQIQAAQLTNEEAKASSELPPTTRLARSSNRRPRRREQSEGRHS